VDVTLIDRRNFHLFQPLLYQVGTGALSPANIAMPLRSILRSQQNVSVLLGEVTGFDLDARAVLLEDGGRESFDYLIVATGSTHHYFGHPEWEEYAPGLKTIEDATEIRRRLLLAFESAERAPSEIEARQHLTFVVVGGGPTGVEMAGAIAEIARDTLRSEYRRIRPNEARIVLVEAVDRILQTYAPKLSQRARDDLRKLGVEGADEHGRHRRGRKRHRVPRRRQAGTHRRPHDNLGGGRSRLVARREAGTSGGSRAATQRASERRSGPDAWRPSGGLRHR
jgi:NADH dehydrogenase